VKAIYPLVLRQTLFIVVVGVKVLHVVHAELPSTAEQYSQTSVPPEAAEDIDQFAASNVVDLPRYAMSPVSLTIFVESEWKTSPEFVLAASVVSSS
jgi:hypothetical protein